MYKIVIIEACPGVPYEMRNINTISRSGSNFDTQEGKVNDVEVDTVTLAIQLDVQAPVSSKVMSIFNYEVDILLSVVSLISGSWR